MSIAVMPQIPLLQVGDKRVEEIRRTQAAIARSLEESYRGTRTGGDQLLRFLGTACPRCRLPLVPGGAVGMQTGL